LLYWYKSTIADAAGGTQPESSEVARERERERERDSWYKSTIADAAGGTQPESSEVYSLAIPAGQEAYSEKHSTVKAVGNKFPVLSVSSVGSLQLLVLVYEALSY
jgi:hypothetical protein